MCGVSVLGKVWATLQGPVNRSHVTGGDHLSMSTRLLIRISGFLCREEASSFSYLFHVAELNHTREFMDQKLNYLSYFLFARFLLSLVNLIFLILMKLPGKIESEY